VVYDVLSIRGISKNIDGCAGLIAQQAIRTYNRVPEAHKRWIDQDDLVQEGLIAAFNAEKKYDSKQAKFTTYLHTGLRQRFDHVLQPLESQKRTGSLLELDAPIQLGDKSVLPDVPTSDRQGVCAVDAYLSVCRELRPQAVIWLTSGLLLGRWFRHDRCSEVIENVKDAVSKVGVVYDDFEIFTKDEKACRNALTNLRKDVRIGLGDEMSLRVLECVECRTRYSLASIRSGSYYPESMVCRRCYRRMMQDQSTCFGKVKSADTVGYSDEDVECRLHCPDRSVCSQIIKEKSMPEVDEDLDALDDVDFDDLTGQSATELTDEEEEAPKPVKAKTKVNGHAKPDKAEAKSKDDTKPTKVSKTVEEKPAKPVKAKVKEVEPETETKTEKKVKKITEDPSDARSVTPLPVKVPKTVDEPWFEQSGGKWPYKHASMAQMAFQACFVGIKQQSLQDWVEKNGYHFKPKIEAIKLGHQTGFYSADEFTWKFSDEGGRYKVYDVKFKEVPKIERKGRKKVSSAKSPLIIEAKGVVANGYETDEGFVVTAGSHAASKAVPSLPKNLGSLRDKLRKEKILVADGDYLKYAKPYTFESCSTAASVTLGRNSNGRIEWKNTKGTTMRDLQE
jgi:hypothetical protein